MAKNYKEVNQENNEALATLRKSLPEVMGAFGSLSLAANKAGVLDKKTKELITVALSIAARCDGCIGLHTQALIKLGVTREELLETLSMAIYMGGGPSVVYAAATLKAFDDLKE